MRKVGSCYTDDLFDLERMGTMPTNKKRKYHLRSYDVLWDGRCNVYLQSPHKWEYPTFNLTKYSYRSRFRIYHRIIFRFFLLSDHLLRK